MSCAATEPMFMTLYVDPVLFAAAVLAKRRYNEAFVSDDALDQMPHGRAIDAQDRMCLAREEKNEAVQRLRNMLSDAADALIREQVHALLADAASGDAK